MTASYLDLTDPPSSVLVVVAHPDDIDFGTAGTIARLTEAGSTVTYALVTSGEAGAPEDLPREEVAAIRQAEQTEAAAKVGVHDVRFLGGRDGHLEPNLELRKVISRVIREVKPALVITQNPQRRWESAYASHPDHLAVGEATMAAVYPDARNPHAHTELLDDGLEPHTVPEVWIGGLEPLDVFIDITDVIDKKIAALSCHASQLEHGRFDVPVLLRDWGADITKRLGLPEGRLSEAFRRINTG